MPLVANFILLRLIIYFASPVSCQERAATGHVPLHKNMAKVSGSLRWSRELRERMDANMESFKRIEHA